MGVIQRGGNLGCPGGTSSKRAVSGLRKFGWGRILRNEPVVDRRLSGPLTFQTDYETLRRGNFVTSDGGMIPSDLLIFGGTNTPDVVCEAAAVNWCKLD